MTFLHWHGNFFHEIRRLMRIRINIVPESPLFEFCSLAIDALL